MVDTHCEVCSLLLIGGNAERRKMGAERREMGAERRKLVCGEKRNGCLDKGLYFGATVLLVVWERSESFLCITLKRGWPLTEQEFVEGGPRSTTFL